MEGSTAKVHKVFQELLREWEGTLTITRLRAEVESRRQKRLVIEATELPLGISGFVIGLSDVDLILHRKGMTYLRTDFVILHEMSHLLLGHVARLATGPMTITYNEYVERRQVGQGLFRSFENRYNSPQEQEAELLGTMLLEELTCTAEANERGIPAVIADMYN